MMDLFAAKGTVVCSACGRRFKPELRDEPQGDGSVKRLFQCTRCYWEFPVARISERGLRLTEELQGADIKDEKRIRSLRKEIKKEVTRWAE
jgi:uncharacterized Zn finger protein (UPF0148 family)